MDIDAPMHASTRLQESTAFPNESPLLDDDDAECSTASELELSDTESDTEDMRSDMGYFSEREGFDGGDILRRFGYDDT